MSRHVAFYYDFASPVSYLAYKRLPGIAARTGAVIDYRPVLVGGIFKATGNRSPIEVASKAAWFWADNGRFAARHGIAFQRPPHFPINSVPLMRGAIAAQQEGRLLAYSTAVFDAIWADGLDLDDAGIVADVLTRAGLPAAAIGTDAVKAALRQATDAAVAQGVFGVPTFLVEDTLYFGQDRLDFVEEHLARSEAHV